MKISKITPYNSKNFEWASKFIDDNRKKLKCGAEGASKQFRALKNHEGKFKSLSEQKDGVLMVGMMLKKGGRHAIIVDCGRGLIQDSYEPLSLQLKEEVLRLCASEEGAIMGIRKVTYFGK